ncbi:jmjC domain-containing protein D-like [Selaginella moellendorffii]|uniref:jmjC domain-containing protein D-like n=1 Tax=Selaginella moellendorffii TaxID=88036 RepID=UPI000D1C5DB8|nr:jmjC domain-containing protein D-like [Selaginella moellendorffii]|eukprot:XP_024532000.1 jmjC domain-containing protein D-like [Selaginella moellendorffii]
MEENWRPPSRDEFREMEARNIPEVFPGILRQWPAFERWNPATGGVEHLKEIAGEPLVQAMVSSDGSTFFGDIRSHERVALPFREYLDMVLSPGEHNDHFYLAQVPIRVKDSTEKPPLASLESEISLPEFLDEDAVSNINLWMSSTSSRSSIHYDPYHNVLGVVTGQKKLPCGLLMRRHICTPSHCMEKLRTIAR